MGTLAQRQPFLDRDPASLEQRGLRLDGDVIAREERIEVGKMTVRVVVRQLRPQPFPQRTTYLCGTVRSAWRVHSVVPWMRGNIAVLSSSVSPAQTFQ